MSAPEPVTVPVVRCSSCYAIWPVEINLLDGKPVFMRPKKKRAKEYEAGCNHEIEKAEYLYDDGTWKGSDG